MNKNFLQFIPTEQRYPSRVECGKYGDEMAILLAKCIERLGAFIQNINRTQPAMMRSPDGYDYYDVWKWRNRLTLRLNVAENKNYMKKSFK